ncbi:MAG: M14 family zinc carboxypeptidase [Pseudomonadota bacterium]
MHYRLLLAAVALLAPLFATAHTLAVDGDDPIIVTAYFEDRTQVEALAADYVPWRVVHEKGYLTIGVDAKGLERLEALGFRVELDERATARLRNQQTRLALTPSPQGNIPGFVCYRTVEETLSSAAAIAENFPDLAEWTPIGESWERETGQGGFEVSVLRLTNENIPGPKPKLFAMSAIHAREYATAELNTRFAEYLIDSYGVDADATWLLDAHEIHLVLQANPDGRKQAETGLVWRKNTNQNYCSPTSTARGADLNRNFEFLWGCCGGSSGNQCNETYRGPTPSSEPETQNIQNYLRTIFPDQRGDDIGDAAPADASGVFLDIHSFSELVLWPWGWGNADAPNGQALTTLGRKLAFFNGYEPDQATGLYITDGTTIDFAYGELGLAAYVYELGTEFFQECGVFENTILPDNLQSLLYAAKTARAPYLLPAGPEVIEVTVAQAVVEPGQPVDVSASMSDGRYNNSNGREPTQNIAAARAYVDVAPWEAGATPIALGALDGSFDEVTEDVNGLLPTGGLADGRHIVYVEGEDAAGNRGVVTAAFFYVLDPANAASLAGSVTAADSGLPLEATISTDGFSADTLGGNYDLALPAGDYTVSVSTVSDDYADPAPVDVSLAGGQTQQLDFVLEPFCTVFSDDVEGGNVGWTPDGRWAISPELANSPANAWSDSPGGDYSSNRSDSLTSPVFNLSAYDDVRLSWSQVCDTEATYDFCYVEVSTDGSTWSTLASFDGTANSFSQQQLDLPQLAGASQAQFRFRIDTDGFVSADGWHVDDVLLRAAGAGCDTDDTDSDGVPDAQDNCTLVANADQRDTDGDGFGNVCDADLNNNNIVNFQDFQIFRPRFNSNDEDADFDGDGVVDLDDFFILRDSFGQPPGPAGDLADGGVIGD